MGSAMEYAVKKQKERKKNQQPYYIFFKIEPLHPKCDEIMLNCSDITSECPVDSDYWNNVVNETYWWKVGDDPYKIWRLNKDIGHYKSGCIVITNAITSTGSYGAIRMEPPGPQG